MGKDTEGPALYCIRLDYIPTAWWSDAREIAKESAVAIYSPSKLPEAWAPSATATPEVLSQVLKDDTGF